MKSRERADGKDRRWESTSGGVVWEGSPSLMNVATATYCVADTDRFLSTPDVIGSLHKVHHPHLQMGHQRLKEAK